MRDFRELPVWQRSHAFVLRVYDLTRSFPDDEKFGLCSQLRRAAASIPTNLAEACGRASGPDMARIVNIAMGSASEVRYQLLLAHDLDYLGDDDHQWLDIELEEIKRMLAGLYRSINAQNPRTPSALKAES